jgi:hypothetical protein
MLSVFRRLMPGSALPKPEDVPEKLRMVGDARAELRRGRGESEVESFANAGLQSVQLACTHAESGRKDLAFEEIQITHWLMHRWAQAFARR